MIFSNLSQTLILQTAVNILIYKTTQEVGSHTNCIINEVTQNNFLMNDLKLSSTTVQMTCSADPKSTFMNNLIWGINNGCSCFIVSYGCIPELLKVFEDVHLKSISKYQKKVMVIVPDDQKPRSDMEIHEIFRNGIIKNMIPLTLLLKFNIWTSNLEESWIEIYSAFPFSKSQTPFNRFFFGNLTLEHDMPFIQNIEDLEGLEIRGAFLHYPPFCAINEVEPGTGNSDIYGSNKQLNLNLEGQEGLIFIEFCKKFNCTITARVDYGENWGAISANRSAGTGILGDIGKNKVDVTGISVYIYAMRYNLLQYSFAVQLSQITHVLPKPQRISFLLTPILPFPPFMWISIVVAFSLAALILLVLNKIQRSLKLTHEDEEDLSFTETIITVLKISVYQNVAVKSKAASSLIMFVTLLASAVTIGSLYAGGLSSIMTVAPYEKPVDSIEKLVNTNLKWGINAISFRYPLEKSTLPAHIKYVKDFVVQPSKDWLIDVNAQKAAPMVEKMQSGTLVYLSYINKNNSKFLMMVKETLYKEYTAVVSTKTWPFMEQLNRIVLMQMESGIRYYWEHQSAAKFLSYEVQKNIEENTKLLGNLEPVKLSVPHITGALLFLLFGYTIGIVTFISEILWGKHRKLLSKPLIFCKRIQCKFN